VALSFGRPLPAMMFAIALRFRRNVGASARMRALCRRNAARKSSVLAAVNSGSAHGADFSRSEIGSGSWVCAYYGPSGT
jgi:hypothetical protein